MLGVGVGIHHDAATAMADDGLTPALETANQDIGIQVAPVIQPELAAAIESGARWCSPPR
jgi:hypothetical protein